MTDAHRAARKDEHVSLALAQRQAPPAHADYDDVTFLHHALAGIDAAHVELGVDLLGRRWASPLYINAMTGGTPETGRINRALAIAARDNGIPIATGSASVALDVEDAAASFRVVRDENPDGVVLVNLGADRSVDDARRAVDLVAADALQIHLNAVQETVMPEGRRDFSGWARSIEAIAAGVDVPVVVKEVGAGLSRRTLRELAQLGVAAADVAGAGGTDFARIENARRERPDAADLAGWGQSAVCCLLDAPPDAPLLLASGGVRTPLDVVRALALGARAVGVSGRFLEVVAEGGVDRDAAALSAEVARWSARLAGLHALLGARTPGALTDTDLLLRGRVGEFCALRGIDAGAYSRRSESAPSGGTPDVR